MTKTMIEQYEDTDLCLDCADTRNCEGAIIEHHPTIEENGHFAVVKCNHFHSVIPGDTR